MAEQITPQARADIDPIFEKQLRALAGACQRFAAFYLAGGVPQWILPDTIGGWSGDLTDHDGMAQAFNHTQSDQWYIDATSDPKNPGTTGDLIVTTTQIDELAIMRRAFLARHAYDRRRCLTLAAGRMEGIGHVNGVLIQCGIEYVNRLVKMSKGGDT